MVIDQIVIATVLVALVLLVGHAPAWLIPLVVAAGGHHVPALVRRLHEHDPDARAG